MLIVRVKQRLTGLGEDAGMTTLRAAECREFIAALAEKSGITGRKL
jgi:hypothetical protein